MSGQAFVTLEARLYKRTKTKSPYRKNKQAEKNKILINNPTIGIWYFIYLYNKDIFPPISEFVLRAPRTFYQGRNLSVSSYYEVTLHSFCPSPWWRDGRFFQSHRVGGGWQFVKM